MNIPLRFDSGTEFRQSFLDDCGRAVGYDEVATGGEGAGVSVGIVDSLYAEPERASFERPPEAVRDLTGQEPDREGEAAARASQEYAAHGMWVYRTVTHFAPEVDVYCYRIGDERHFKREELAVPEGRLLDAVERARADGVDLLNVSGGVFHHGCDRACPVADVVGDAVDDGVGVVAAAGNATESQRRQDEKHVLCPALLERVLGVGGFEPLCDGPVRGGEGQYWVELDPVDALEKSGTQGPLCGDRGCTVGTSCVESRRVRWFRQSVLPAGGKPDVLAPAFYPRVETDVTYFLPGTSWATPVVTGVVAAVCSTLDVRPSGRPLVEAALAGAGSDDIRPERFSEPQPQFDAAAFEAALRE